MAISHRQMTLEEFLALPEEKPALEYADGKVTQKVSPQGVHAAIQTLLAEQINVITRPRKLALALAELRSTYGGRSYVPDVAVYRWERIPRDEDGKIADDFSTPPDIAIEIVSPEQRLTPLFRQCLWYVSHGVKVALLIDPEDESVLVFRDGPTTEALGPQDTIDLSAVIPGLTLTVQQVLGSLRVD